MRLKGGDPFVFGRGGEEAEALHNAGVPFEVVPGITASIGGTAYAGIPVTHRDFNSSFTVITGHEKEEEYKDQAAKARGAAAGSSDLDWDVIAKLPAMAFYMGVKSLPRITEKLIAHGRDANTPAATVQWGTTARQKTAVGTIGTIVDEVRKAGISSPAITIVGKVVTLRPVMNWFESRPLFGQTVVVTRTRQQASELSESLEALGADVIEAPTIELAPPPDWRVVDQALREMSSFDWIIFTSQNGVTYAKQRLFEIGLDARAFGRAKLAAIGDATATAVRDELALKVDLCPESFVAEALAEALISKGEVRNKRYLLLRADIARPVLRERLVAAQAAEVRDVPVYETKIAAALPEGLVDAITNRTVQWLTFTSSSTARNFLTLLGHDYKNKLASIKVASIGPITSKTLREMGIEPTVEAETFNVEGLVAALKGN